MDEKTDKCRLISESLVDYADGCLDVENREAVEAHMSGCKTCRRRLWALQRSLDLARREWEAPARRTTRATRRWRLPAMAAGIAAAAVWIIVLAVAGQRAHTPPPSPVPVAQATTAEEMILAVQREEAAARLLFAADQMASVPSLGAQAVRSKEYISDHYANTTAGRSLRAGLPEQGVTQ
jgi:anti-sigma factor RsiW